MDKWKNYLRSALCSIKHNKVYALFCVVGTAFTFVFIIIMLQLVYDTTSDKAPFVNGDRTIVFNTFQDVKGRNVGGIYSGSTAWLMERIREKTGFGSIKCQTFLENSNGKDTDERGLFHVL